MHHTHHQQQLLHNKRRLSDAAALLAEHEGNLLEVTPLGAGQEVGRSCIVLRYQ
jgi:predicted metal-dependent RNase